MCIRDRGLKESDIYKTVMVSPAELERLLHTKLNKGKAKREKGRVSSAKVHAMVDESGLTVKPAGQKTLAPDSDNRSALPKDGDVFDSWD